MRADRTDGQLTGQNLEAGGHGAPTGTARYDKESAERFRTFLRKIEDKLRVPEGFLWDVLTEETDWAFCLKLHALVESAVNITLQKAVREERLHKELAKLPIKTKLKMAEDLKAITGEQAGFVDALGSTRNTVAHQVANIPGFSLEKHVAAVDNGVRQRLVGSAAGSAGKLRTALLGRAMEVLLDLDLGESVLEIRFRAELEQAISARSEVEQAAILELLDAPSTSPDASQR